MSAETKKGYGLTVFMIVFGLLAVYGGASWLPVLVPIAALVWFSARRPVAGVGRR